MSPLRTPARLLLALAVIAALVGASAPALAAGAAPAAGTAPPVVGNITGPTFAAENSNTSYFLNASGGPAVSDGTLVGTITFTASVAGPNLNGVSISPVNGTVENLGSPVKLTLRTSNLTETITLEVHVLSRLAAQNATLNLTYAVQITVPYTVSAVVVAGATGVGTFVVVVALDGVRVGNVTVPGLSAHQRFTVAFRYASAGIASGYHTFTMSLVSEHGLVAFANGLMSFSSTFYVAPGPTNESIWYVAGAVAFFGALFIFATRVAARRRGAGRK